MERKMIQCVCCSTVFTKDGFPNKFFNYDDRHIYGCTQCKLGDWVRHSKTTLVGYKVSTVKDLEGNEKDDTGYLDYFRDRNKQIEGIPWKDLLSYPRQANRKLEMVENIELEVA